MNNKKLIVTTGVAIAVAISVAGLMIQSPAVAQQLALPNTTTSSPNNGTMMPRQMVNITGSVNIEKIIKDNVKVSFTDAASAAQKEVSGGAIVGGHLDVVQGSLVYTFKVVDPANNTGHFVIVDAGNGHVLYTSQGHSLAGFGGGGFGGGRWCHHGSW